MREARPANVDFARALYFETMRGMIEPLFGWDQRRQEESFAEWFDLQQASIIIADGRDVGWMQTRANGNSSLFPQLWSRRGVSPGSPKSLLRSKYLDHHGAYPGLGCAAR